MKEMENVEKNNAKYHHDKLCVPTNESKRRKKILTKDDDKAAIIKVKRIKNKQQAVSSQVNADSFNDTVLNNKKKELEKKQKLLAEIEAKQTEKDNQIKQEMLKRRNKIVEKALANKWLAKDSTKTVNREEQIMQVLKERDMQIEFNKAEKAKLLEEKRLLIIEQDKEAEQYIKNRWEQKMKEAVTKKSNAASYLKLLKDRKNKRRDENVKLIEEGKKEIQQIVKEIEKHNEIERNKIQKIKENTLKNLKENQEIVSKNKELRRLEEQDENEIIAILAKSKKKITKKIKLKELETLKKKFELSNQIMEKTIQIQAKKQNISDLAFQNAVKEKERQYQEERIRKEELARKKKEDFEEYKKLLDEENQKEKERLALSRQWELNRRMRETEVLNDLEKLHNQAIIDEKKHFREHLDAQCANNRAASLADKREDQKHYYELINLWRQEDEKFLTYTRNLIDKYKKAGKSVVPFLKVIKDYVEKNKLLADAINTN